MIILYGIKTCSTVAKARKWLRMHEIEHQFHDFRQDCIEVSQLQDWIDQLGWQILLNKRSLTWRKLTDEMKQEMNELSALTVMEEQPVIIKRPVLVENNKILAVGFTDKKYTSLFGEKN